jgi:hypothetical protein
LQENSEDEVTDSLSEDLDGSTSEIKSASKSTFDRGKGNVNIDGQISIHMKDLSPSKITQALTGLDLNT